MLWFSEWVNSVKIISNDKNFFKSLFASLSTSKPTFLIESWKSKWGGPNFSELSLKGSGVRWAGNVVFFKNYSIQSRWSRIYFLESKHQKEILFEQD